MQVRTADAPARRVDGHHAVYFRSDHCGQRFDADPDRYARCTGGKPTG